MALKHGGSIFGDSWVELAFLRSAVLAPSRILGKVCAVLEVTLA